MTAPGRHRNAAIAGVVLVVAWVGCAAAVAADPGEEAAFSDFNDCVRRSERRDIGPERCLSRLRDFVAARPKAEGLALRAAKLALHQWNAARAAPFFAAAAARSRAFCADPDLATSTVAGLSQAAGEAPEIVASSRLLVETCWAELRGPVLEAFAARGENMLANACDALSARRALSGLQTERCAAIAAGR